MKRLKYRYEKADAWSFVQASNGCWEWIGQFSWIKKNGVSIRRYGKMKVASVEYAAHRLIWELCNGPIPDGLWVLHTCDNPACVKPSHLFLGTALDNNQDMITKGRNTFGDRHWTRRFPGRLPRGDQHHARRHPENLARGDKHGMRIKSLSSAVAA